MRSLAWKGRYLVVGFAAGDIPKIPLNLLLLKGCGAGRRVLRAASPSASRWCSAQNVSELWQLFEAGKLRPPVVGEVHPLADYARAFGSLEQRGRSARWCSRMGVGVADLTTAGAASGLADRLELGVHLEPALLGVAELGDDLGAAPARRLHLGRSRCA